MVKTTYDVNDLRTYSKEYRMKQSEHHQGKDGPHHGEQMPDHGTEKGHGFSGTYQHRTKNNY